MTCAYAVMVDSKIKIEVFKPFFRKHKFKKLVLEKNIIKVI